MDYAAVPPEINSGRMYAGPGAGPLVAAAAAWDGLAAELNIAAASYRSTVTELTGGPWAGPSSTTMAAAASPYMSWMSGTAARAEQTASQLKSAIAAYEAAFTATVPPPEIEVNRALLAALAATNLLGQNTPAIMATEAQYAEMWAQDAAAMYGYAAASSVAAKLTPFNPPPQATNSAGTTTQAAAVNQAVASATGSSAQTELSQVISSVPVMLHGLSSAASYNPFTFLHELLTTDLGNALNTLSLNFGNFTLTISGFLFTASGITPLLGGLYGLLVPGALAATAADVAPDVGLGALVGSYDSATGGALPAGMGGAAASAGLGKAATVGNLSVPQSWASAPGVQLAASASPLATAGLNGLPQAEPTGTGFFGIPPVGSFVNAPRGDQTRARSGSDHNAPPQSGESGADRYAVVPSAQPQKARKHVASALSEREREELDKLRKEITEVATERDAAARLIKEAML